MRFASTPPDRFDTHELQIIRDEARVFVRTWRLRWSDEDDLVQQGWIAWETQRDRYDPRRGSVRTFLKRVVRSAFMDVAKEERTVGRKAGHHALSLDAPLTPAGETRLADLLPAPDDIAATEARVYITGLFGKMTPRQRAIVRETLDGYQQEEIADQLGVHRDTAHQDRVKLREVFRREDLL